MQFSLSQMLLGIPENYLQAWQKNEKNATIINRLAEQESMSGPSSEMICGRPVCSRASQASKVN